ncbi:MAG: metallophosphoesterase [Bacteriovoracaceae bacterium]|jgi:uncharacterized protein|nr:metallophosphoesterase [Bacteriovoracaceae bacterium]
MDTSLALFYGFLIILIAFILFYLKRRIHQFFKEHRYPKLLVWIFFALSVLMIGTLVTYRTSHIPVSQFYGSPLLWTSYIFMGFIGPFFLVLVAFDLMRLGTRPIKSKIKINPDRREFLKKAAGIGIFAGPGILSASGPFGEELVPKVVEVVVQVKDLPQKLVGLTIAQVSDIHIGPLLRGDFLEKIVAEVNSLKADIITITGDLVDGRVSQLESELSSLSELKADLGVYFCSGNHELYWGYDSWLNFVENKGITVFRNDHKVISKDGEKFMIAGVHDHSIKRMIRSMESSPKKAVEGAEHLPLKILLAHQPKSCFEAQKAGFDLQLSGHTHAGQYFPWNLFIGLFQPYVKGLHQLQNLSIYVNSGTGYWGPPNRLGVPAEITLLKLERTEG